MKIATPSKALRAALILPVASLLVGLLASEPAEARRFGGGRSHGINRSVPETLHVRPATPSVEPRSAYPSTAYAPHPENNALNSTIGNAANIAYLARIAAQRERILAARRDTQPAIAATSAAGVASAVAAHSASAMPDAHSASAAPAAALPTVRSMRAADPDFGRITENRAAEGRPCEFKPVMSDADYIACNVTPPQLAPISRRN